MAARENNAHQRKQRRRTWRTLCGGINESVTRDMVSGERDEEQRKWQRRVAAQV